MRLILIMHKASRWIPGIKLTFNIPENHTDKKYPVLHLAVWLERRQETGES